jgi:adenylosuccinate lyase
LHHSLIYRDYFGTKSMRAIWTEDAMVQCWLDYEAAFARAEGKLRIIPPAVAERISARCTTKVVTPEAIAAWRERTGHVIVSLVNAFRDVEPKAGELFHYGLTTQDVLDTGLTLQIRASLRVLVPALVNLTDVVVQQAERYRAVPQIGRTEGQHGSPITFGYKLGVLASELSDHVERLLECSKRVLILTMFGATGVQSSFCALAGQSGARRLADLLGKELDLEVPPICPHHRTDRFAELGYVLSLVLSTLGEAGLEIRDLQRTEVAEVSEAWGSDQYSSSTMPQKRNPEMSEWLEGLAKLGRANALSLADIQQQHERDITRLPAEFAAIPSLFLNTHAAIEIATKIYRGLVVNEQSMRNNLRSHGGLSMSEAVMLALSRKSKRKVWAHRLVHDIAMRAGSGQSFESLLGNDPAICKYLTRSEINNLLQPERYLGTAQSQVRAVATRWRQRRARLIASSKKMRIT